MDAASGRLRHSFSNIPGVISKTYIRNTREDALICGKLRDLNSATVTRPPLRRVLSRLGVPHLGILPVLRQELLMGTFLDNVPLLKHQNTVRISGG